MGWTAPQSFLDAPRSADELSEHVFSPNILFYRRVASITFLV